MFSFSSKNPIWALLRLTGDKVVVTREGVDERIVRSVVDTDSAVNGADEYSEELGFGVTEVSVGDTVASFVVSCGVTASDVVKSDMMAVTCGMVRVGPVAFWSANSCDFAEVYTVLICDFVNARCGVLDLVFLILEVVGSPGKVLVNEPNGDEQVVVFLNQTMSSTLAWYCCDTVVKLLSKHVTRSSYLKSNRIPFEAVTIR